MSRSSDLKLRLGHRQRLKHKIFSHPIRTFNDVELLEVLLFYALPRVDTKRLAKKLLTRFGCLQNIIQAEQDKLEEIIGIGTNVVIFFKVLLDIFSRLYISHQSAKMCYKENILNHWSSVLRYCQLTMSNILKEICKIIFLDTKNRVISDELLQEGSFDKIHIHFKDILRRCLEYNAQALILVHNHPGGNSSPSENDISLTKKLQNSLAAIEVHLHDHIIIGHNNFFSFRESGLI